MKLLVKIKDSKKLIEQLEAIGHDQHKKLFKLLDNDYIEIMTWRERDIAKHRRYFALMNCTINHLPEHTPFSDINTLRKTIQICIGNCEIAFDMQGNKQLQALSINFKKMDQVSFDELYMKSLNYISKVLLSHIDYDEFVKDILNFY